MRKRLSFKDEINEKFQIKSSLFRMHNLLRHPSLPLNLNPAHLDEQFNFREWPPFNSP